MEKALISLSKEESVLMFLNIRPKFLVQTSSSLMLVENESNHIVTKMFLTYTIITEKSLIKQEKMVRCSLKDIKKHI